MNIADAIKYPTNATTEIMTRPRVRRYMEDTTKFNERTRLNTRVE